MHLPFKGPLRDAYVGMTAGLDLQFHICPALRALKSPRASYAPFGRCRRPYVRTALDQTEIQSETLPRLYCATFPLVGWEALETTLRQAFPDSLAMHSIILVEEANGGVTVFDFLPGQPKSPVVAATLLAGGCVKGVLRERKLSKRPAKRCWLLGSATQHQVGMWQKVD